MSDPSHASEPAPRVLVVTSAGAPGAVVTSVLAALEAAGVEIRALDVGRLGPRASWRVWEAVLGDLAERKLHQELADNPPDVALAFEPAAVAALCAARDEAVEGAPVLAVVPALDPDATWAQTDADRYLTIDDEAAVALADAGVPEDRVIPVGAMGERAFSEAAEEGRAAVRKRFNLGEGPIALVEIAGLGSEIASQIALQLSLVPGRPLFLFDAGGDSDAAHALRAQVPTLEIRAKLFGATADAAQLWRAADVIIARPRPRAVARVLVLGARMVGLSPEPEEEEALAALERRGLASAASNPLLLSSALEPLFGRGARDDDRVGADGAGTVADAARIVAAERDAVLGEIRAARSAARSARVDAATRAAESQARRTRAAGDLEDLGGGAAAGGAAGSAPEPAVDREEIDELIRQIARRTDRGKKRLVEARQAADSWQAQAEKARRAGEDATAQNAQGKADRERQRMHEVLSELAELEQEMTRLKRARSAAGAARSTPPRGGGGTAGAGGGGKTPSGGGRGASRSVSVDELLEKLKRQEASGTRRDSRGGARNTGDVDDELEALKKKIEESRRRR